ncbi:hypothetical protein [Bacillus phage PK2]|nr:hypothetical protein [Bacillus phage PK2]
MTNLKTQVEQMVMEIDEDNAMYIMNDGQFESKLGTAERFEAKGDTEMVGYMIEDMKRLATEFSSKNLTPANVKVGDGVTMGLYSDAHAGTVVKVTKTQVIVQRDKATLDPNWKPEVVAGGFAGHCTNQDSQTYTYEQDPNGELTKFTWSKKFNQYRNNQRGMKLYKGRREFYDYNF